LRRGWLLAPDERVAIVDDILTTGTSLLETVEAVRAAGAEPVAAAVIVDRSGGLFDLGPPLHSLGSLDIASWEPDECELCAAGVALRKPGSS
jgi:orotate phosphoribosyltransferase